MKTKYCLISNSSSSSFIVIGNSTPDYNQIKQFLSKSIVNDVLTIGKYGQTEFGWGPEVIRDWWSNINFAYLQARYVEETHPEWLEMLNKVLKNYSGANEVEYVIGFWEDEEKSEGKIKSGYIDHQSASHEGENTEMFESEDDLIRFLFSPDSKIVLDNDNH